MFMEELRIYFKKTLKNDAERSAYARACGTTLLYLRKLVNTKKERVKIDGALCRLLDEHSGGKVRKELLRPDIWPELLSKRERAA